MYRKELMSTNTDLVIQNGSEGSFEFERTDEINTRNVIVLKITNTSSVPYEIVEILTLYTKLNNEVQFEKQNMPIRIKQKKEGIIKINYCFSYQGVYCLPIILKTVNKGTSISHNFLKELVKLIRF